MSTLFLLLGGFLLHSVSVKSAEIPADVFRRLLSNQELILEQLAALQPTPEECPAGWSRHEDRCYLIPVTTASWHQAHRDCALLDRRAGLASVHPTSAHHLRAVVSASQVPRVWIGLLRLAGRGSGWLWSDGSPLDLTKWAMRAPSNYGRSNKHCAMMQSGVAGRWVDVQCNQEAHFICQVQLTRRRVQ